ncbi:MAG: hypothetical protein PHU64_03170 [Candidatus Omnitrophica bacterium]|nr:hypothetical protein [Candidatus Omnitrophota bacterium]MDD5429965.1 hypothetical protein [Candidatus Omnitrophota bacterium]
MRKKIFPLLLAAFLSNFFQNGFSQSSRYAFNDSARDPFEPLVNKAGFILIPKEIDVTGLAVQGIIYSKDLPLAIINGEVVKQGDYIGDYNVVQIEVKRVILKKGNESFTLTLEEE